MRNTFAVALMAFVISAASPAVQAGGIGKAIAKATMKKALRRDLARDVTTPAKPLPRDRIVWRYTTRHQANREAKSGLAPNTHMTSPVHAGRPLSAGGAQEKFGLPVSPEAKETIRLPKGHPVRLNKAIHGKPGVGETTSPKRLPPDAIVKVEPVPAGKNFE